MSTPLKVVSSPSGMEHYYRTAFGAARTLCGKPVPQHRGWFGPIDRPATCAQCIRRQAQQTPPAIRLRAAASGDGAPVGCLPPDPRPAAPQQTRTQR